MNHAWVGATCGEGPQMVGQLALPLIRVLGADQERAWLGDRGCGQLASPTPDWGDRG